MILLVIGAFIVSQGSAEDCLGRGDLKDGWCICNDDYMGKHCETHRCNDRGYVNHNEDACVCYGNWTGAACTKCHPSHRRRGNECCPEEYYGKQCQWLTAECNSEFSDCPVKKGGPFIKLEGWPAAVVIIVIILLVIGGIFYWRRRRKLQLQNATGRVINQGGVPQPPATYQAVPQNTGPGISPYPVQATYRIPPQPDHLGGHTTMVPGYSPPVGPMTASPQPISLDLKTGRPLHHKPYPVQRGDVSPNPSSYTTQPSRTSYGATHSYEPQDPIPDNDSITPLTVTYPEYTSRPPPVPGATSTKRSLFPRSESGTGPIAPPSSEPSATQMTAHPLPSYEAAVRSSDETA